MSIYLGMVLACCEAVLGDGSTYLTSLHVRLLSSVSQRQGLLVIDEPQTGPPSKRRGMQQEVHNSRKYFFPLHISTLFAVIVSHICTCLSRVIEKGVT